MFKTKKIFSYSLQTLKIKMQFEKCTECIHKKIYYNNTNLTKIFLKSLESVNTKKIIQSAVNIIDGELYIYGRKYELNNKCYVVGFGKAILNMAVEIERILENNIIDGVCSVPTGIFNSDDNRKMVEGSRIRYYEGAENNIPDLQAVTASEEILALADKLTKDDLLIVLVSGGGSALLPLPISPVTLEEKQDIIKTLCKNGADITELNCVRKRMSVLKGGGLARHAYPANVVALILSDVIGNPLDIIASGPTTPNTDLPMSAWRVMRRYGMLKSMSENVQEVLGLEMEDDFSDIPLTPYGEYIHVENYLIGSNEILAEAAKQDAIRRGYQCAILSTTIEGRVREVSKVYADIASEIAQIIKGLSSTEYLELKLNWLKNKINLSREGIKELINLDYTTDKGICIVLAGEPTVQVWGSGKGGRNQHLALQFSVDIAKEINNSILNIKNMNISILSCGTDGIDGPTDAAGAIGTSNLCELAEDQYLKPERFLRSCNSYGFYKKFQKGKYMIKTGHTGTNVMDLHLIMINKGEAFDPDREEFDHLLKSKI